MEYLNDTLPKGMKENYFIKHHIPESIGLSAWLGNTILQTCFDFEIYLRIGLNVLAMIVAFLSIIKLLMEITEKLFKDVE